jgi:pSer/pThr/pTyr-binding forkhead associated (FHA) protein/tetratricopeptide (TPR) repeat protein
MTQRVELVIRREGQPERRVLLAAGTTHLGRAEDNDVVLPEIGVSRRHASIIVGANGVVIEDMGSGNGTWYAGRKVQQQAVQDSDEIVIDPFRLAFRLRPNDDHGALQDAALPNDGRNGAPAEPADSNAARLVVLSGHRLDPTYTLEQGRLTMGRSEGRDVVLFDPASSRRHCEIVRRDADFWLIDGGSANGTHVNGLRVRECPLRTGDRIRIGTTEFRFDLPEGGTPKTKGNTVPKDLAASVARIDRPTRIKAPRPTQRRSSGLAAVVGSLLLLGVVFAFGLMVVVAAAVALNWTRITADGPVATKQAVSSTGASTSTSASSSSSGATAPPSTGAAVAVPTPLSAEAAANATRATALLDMGTLLFQRGRYLDAASQYYKVLKLSPDNEQAERMGYVACEYIAMDRMRDAVLIRSTPLPKRELARSLALSLGESALAGRSELPAARTALREATVLLPSDKALAALLVKVQEAEDIAINRQQAETHRKKIETLYKLAKVQVAKGDDTSAAIAFEAVMVADPDKKTTYYFDARTALAETRTRLQAQAEAAFVLAQGRESAGDTAGARLHYQQVVTLAGPESEVGRRAAARLSALPG